MTYKVTKDYGTTYLEECLVLWEFSSKKARQNAKTYFFCCLVYLAIGLLYYSKGKPISLFISSLGLACFILLVIQLFSIYYSKAVTKKNVLAQINKYRGISTATNDLFFTEDYIRYSDPEKLIEVKWAAISHYQEAKNYILFFMKEIQTPTFSMDKNNIPDSIKNDLFTLINSKITLRK